MIPKRCHFYDNDGYPRVMKDGFKGCRRGSSCVFVHPDQPQWDTAEPVPAPYHLMSPQPNPRSHARSPPRPRRPPSPQSSPAKPPDRDRRDPPRARSPLRPPHPPPPRPRSPVHDAARDRDRSRTRGGPDPPPAPSSSRSTMPPPPAPPGPKATSLSRSASVASEASMRPLSPSVGKSGKELSADEKKHAWVERIKAISDASIARNDYIQLEQDIQRYQRLKQAWKYVDVPEAEKSRFEAQLSSLQEQCAQKRKDLGELTERLMESDFWPTTSKSVAVSVRTTVEDLQDKVKSIFETVQKLEASRLSSNTEALPTKEDTPTADTPHPPKRRRLENGDVGSSMTDESKLNDTALPAAFDELKDRVLTLESHLADLQNELVQWDNHALTAVEEEMEHRFEQYGLVKLGESSSSWQAPVPIPTLTHPSAPPISGDPAKTGVLETELHRAGSDIQMMAKEVGELISRADTRDTDLLALYEENQLLKNQVATVQEMQRRTLLVLEGQKAEIEALKAAMTVFVSQSKPESVPGPSVDDIIESCRPQLLHAIRQDIQPLLDEMKTAVETMLQNQSTELCNLVLTKLQATTRTVQAIAQWVDSVKQGGVHPAATAANGAVTNGIAPHPQKPEKQPEKVPTG